MFDNFEQRLASQINNSYPPYNILKHDDNSYELEIAVTGFTPEEITVEIDQNQLVVHGVRVRTEDSETQYLHRGLATRDFTRSWTLAEHMEVGEGKIKNGVLTIALTRVVPEALKPRQLKITAE
jgi:molecular chaperone IbpA